MSSSEQPNQPELPDPSDRDAASRAQPAHHAAEPVETIVDEQTVIVRRAPRYFNFMLVGAVVGAVVAFILTVSFPENPDFGRLQVFGFLLIALLAFGVGLGCLVALIVDRFVGRTGTTAVVDRLDGHVPGATPDVSSPANQAYDQPAASPANDGNSPGASNSHDSGTKPE